MYIYHKFKYTMCRVLCMHTFTLSNIFELKEMLLSLIRTAQKMRFERGGLAKLEQKHLST